VGGGGGGEKGRLEYVKRRYMLARQLWRSPLTIMQEVSYLGYQQCSLPRLFCTSTGGGRWLALACLMGTIHPMMRNIYRLS